MDRFSGCTRANAVWNTQVENASWTESFFHEQSYGRALRRPELATMVDASRDAWQASESTKLAATMPQCG